jgi:hypothetical protein
MASPGIKALEIASSAATIIPKLTARRWFMTMIVGERTSPVYSQHSARGPGVALVQSNPVMIERNSLRAAATNQPAHDLQFGLSCHTPCSRRGRCARRLTPHDYALVGAAEGSLT